MTAPQQDRLESALAELHAQQAKIREFRGAMTAQKTAVASKNRMISATVNSQGRLVELSFKGNRYRSLAPAELSTLIVETVAKAQETASKQTLAAAGALVPDGFGFPGLTGGELGVDEMFDAALRLVEQPIFADEAGRDESKGLRDV